MELVPRGNVSVAVQSVIYQTPVHGLRRLVEHLDNSARVGASLEVCDRLVLLLGDASPAPVLTDEAIDDLRELAPHIEEISYTFFGENTGTARGHNRLAALAQTDFLVTSNPDVVPDARALWRLLAAFDDPRVGFVEAKQLPVEHPKAYVPETGATSWSSTAFAMTPRALFAQLGGFDETTFFMYCDDVDYSWRVREAGLEVVFQPSAAVFHDKRLTLDGRWQATGAERFYSAQAALLLAHKWSRDDVVADLLKVFDAMNSPDHRAAAEEFRRRRDAGELVPQHDVEHRIGQFTNYRYAEHRYAL